VTVLECLLVGMEGGGGEEVFVRDLAENPPAGVRYTLALRHHESVTGARSRRVTEVLFNRLVHPWIWPLAGLKAYRVDRRFDLVHVHNYAHHISSPDRVPVVMSLGGGSYYHYVQAYLGWPEERMQALYRRGRTVFRTFGITNEFVNWGRLSGIFVRSEFARGFLLRMGVPVSLVEVIPPGFSVPAPPVRPLARDGFTFLFVGRDPIRKGADLVIDAIRVLRGSRGLRVRAIMVGDPSFRELSPEDGFEAHPWVKREVLYRELYPRADALLLPSRVEGYGIAPIEAMSFGIPVIASRYGALPETVLDQVTGLLVTPGDGESLRQAMTALATDARRAREMGAAGRARFEAEYTRERFHERLLAFYERALAGS